MSPLRSSSMLIAFSALLFSLALPALAQFPIAKCPAPYKIGELCMGAAGKPVVRWCGCEDGAGCSGPAGAEGYGATCVKTGDKCYAPGERCLGAPGKPYVANGGRCCVEGSECTDDNAEYGKQCTVPAGSTKEGTSPTTAAPAATTPSPTTVAPTTASPTTAAPTTAAPANKTCYAPGERCLGAPGKPYVAYGGRCCVEGSECTDDNAEYGKQCTVPAGSTKEGTAPTTAAPAATTPSATTAAPTTAAATTASPSTAAPTTAAPTTASPTTAAPTTAAPTNMTCYAPGERCSGAPGKPYVHHGDGCCEKGSLCVDNNAEYGMQCSAPIYG